MGTLELNSHVRCNSAPLMPDLIHQWSHLDLQFSLCMKLLNSICCGGGGGGLYTTPGGSCMTPGYIPNIIGYNIIETQSHLKNHLAYYLSW